MRLRALRQDPIAITVAAILIAVCLVTVNSVWPEAFPVSIAIGGVLGALLVLYEVRLTKRLAQAEFVRDLQSGFSSDENICYVWNKLLLGETITDADRAKVSSYLTFFETLHLLVDRGALDIGLTDDLFRNRFFKAVGDRGILDTALVKQAGSFSNIHSLIVAWHHHLVRSKIPMHPGYYAYVEALTEAKGYDVRRLDLTDLVQLKALQTEVLASGRAADWLRANTDEMLRACVVDHLTLGVFKGEVLVAAAVLFDGQDSEENIKRYESRDPESLARAINLKLVLASPSHRKRGLGRTLVELLEREAIARGKTEILCTIHPRNTPSKELFRLLGYEKVKSVQTSYGKRVVFSRAVPQEDRRWAR